MNKEQIIEDLKVRQIALEKNLKETQDEAGGNTDVEISEEDAEVLTAEIRANLQLVKKLLELYQKP